MSAEPPIPAALRPLLDRNASAEARDEGMGRSDANALAEWKAEADEIIERLARSRAEFGSDDVWEEGLSANPTGSNTALGARFRVAASKGLISKTRRITLTEQVRSHRSPMAVWVSLVYEGERDASNQADVVAARCRRAAGWVQAQESLPGNARSALAELLKQAADTIEAT